MENAYYFDTKKWEVNQEGRGFKVNPIVGLMLATVFGGLFVVFLPFIGLYLFGKFIVSRLVEGLHSLIHTTVAPIAAPGNAYLTGSDSKKTEPGENTLTDLASEIDNKRKG